MLKSQQRSPEINQLLQQGLALYKQDKLSEAQQIYEQILKLQPQHFDALVFLGMASAQTSNFNRAIHLWSIAIKINPYDALCNFYLGKALIEIKNFDSAIASFDKAISLKPDFSEAYLSKGHAQKEIKKFEDAVASFDKAINIKPDFAEAYYDRATTLQDMARLNEARESFIKSLELKPQLGMARWAMAFLSIPPIFSCLENINASRDDFTLGLKQLDEWFTSEKLEGANELIGTSQPFYLAYQEVNNKELMLKYGLICNRIMNYWQKTNGIKAVVRKNSGKIKIGIVGEQIRNHSVWNAITKGWLLNIDREEFEVHIFDLGGAYDDETKLAQLKATSFTKNQSTLIDWAKVVIEKGIEVLIYPEIGMHHLTLQLSNLRLSPIQIASWGHPETTGLPTIDYYLSADLFETSSSENAYTEYLIKLPNLGCYYSRSTIIATELDIKELGLDTKEPILLCPGVLFKYAPQYDWVLIDIVKRLGTCKLVFFNYQKNWVAIFKKRLEIAFNESGLLIDDYVTFVPWLKLTEFYGLMKQADVFLDTIGFSGFNTAMQAIDCGLPIVTKEGEFMRGRLASGILKRMDMQELISESEDEYIDLVVKLVQDKNYRDAIKRTLIKKREILYDDIEPIRVLEDFLISNCRGNKA